MTDDWTDDWISAMKEPDGSLVGDVPSICDSWVSFYSTLLSACPTNIDVQNRLLDNLSSALPPSQVHLCEGHLTTDEVHEALLGMAKRKSPGTEAASQPNSTWPSGMSWVLTLLRF